MICSQSDIDSIAERIEGAYRRRHLRWPGLALSPGVWESAALTLLQLSIDRPNIPIDPELYVAVMIESGSAPDPWAELTQRRSRNRYLKALRRIVGQLRRELHGEFRVAARLISEGQALIEVLEASNLPISPLTRFILAWRAGRPDLSSRLRAAVENQHQSCPLYLLACRKFLPAQAYPVPRCSRESSAVDREIVHFSLN